MVQCAFLNISEYIIRNLSELYNLDKGYFDPKSKVR